jgi:hypothetical protein
MLFLLAEELLELKSGTPSFLEARREPKALANAPGIVVNSQAICSKMFGAKK